MTCPVCDEKTKITNSADVGGSVLRKRVCSSCGYVFYTEELDVPEKDMPQARKLLNAKRQGDWAEKKRRQKSDQGTAEHL